MNNTNITKSATSSLGPRFAKWLDINVKSGRLGSSGVKRTNNVLRRSNAIYFDEPYLLNNPQAGVNDSTQLAEVSEKDRSMGEVKPIIMGSNTATANDAEVLQTTLYRDRIPISALSSLSADRFKMSLEDFLAKPTIMQSGTFQNGDTATSFGEINIRDVLTTINVREKKLEGVYGMRCTFVFTLQINANPFQDGRYIMYWNPTGGSSTIANRLMHNFSIIQCTQLPNVEIDIACDTVATLRIPWVSTYPFMSVGQADAKGAPGYVRIRPYVSVRTVAGSTTVPYTMWVHCEDVELYGSAVPQSGRAKSSKKMKKDLITEEVESKFLSTGLGVAADISAAVSKVPLLSSLAGPLSWVLRAGADAARAWGWSKPVVIDKPVRVYREPISYLANSDTHTTTSPLSMFVDNHVEILPGFAGTDNDELSIDYIKGIDSAFGSNVTWNFTDTVGTAIATIPLYPTNFSQVLNDGAVATRNYSTIAWLAENFSLWRGGFRFKFKFVKTKFHSGRLMFAFAAYDPELTSVVSYTNAQYIHKTIIDIREINELTVDVPYISKSTWRNTDSVNDKIGDLIIYVVDPLVYPATVSSTVIIIPHVCGADDMQFAVPRNFAGDYVLPNAIQAGTEGTDMDPCSIGHAVIGAADTQSDTTLAHSTCIGEYINSLRHILKRGGLTGASTGTGNSAYIYPNTLQVLSSNGVVASGSGLRDPMSTILPLFALFKGSVRIRGLATSVSNPSVAYVSHVFARSTFTTPAAFLTNPGETQSQFVYDSGNSGMNFQVHDHGAFDVQIPHYNQNPSKPVITNMIVNGTGTAFSNNTIDRNVIICRFAGATTNGYEIYRSVGEDFNVGLFCSIPPVISYARP